MSTFLTIIKALAAIPELIKLFRDAFVLWTNEVARRAKEKSRKENDEIHDDIENGGRPDWDDSRK